MKQVNIVRIVPHPLPHLDEIVSAEFARKFGGRILIGVESAPIIPQTLTGSEDEALAKGDLPLGQLYGIFDDKVKGTGQRKPKTCCAMEMAKVLGIETDERLEKLFKAVIRVDGSATASPSDLSSLLKAAFEGFPEVLHPKIAEWGAKGVRAIIETLIQSNGVPATDTIYVHPAYVLEEMVKREMVTHGAIIDRMRRMVHGSVRQIDNCLELSFISRAMAAMGVGHEEVIEWITTALDQCIKLQVQFLDAVKEVQVARRYPIDPRFDRDHLAMVLIRSGNSQVAKASRAEPNRIAVCAVRRDSGNIAIIPNAVNRLDMRLVWALIRLHETAPERRHLADLGQYIVTGNHPEAPHWHMMENGATLNGSRAIKSKPSTLGDDLITKIIRIGFTADGIYEFNRLRGGNGELSASEADFLSVFKPRFERTYAAQIEGHISGQRKGVNSLAAAFGCLK